MLGKNDQMTGLDNGYERGGSHDVGNVKEWGKIQGEESFREGRAGSLNRRALWVFGGHTGPQCDGN